MPLLQNLIDKIEGNHYIKEIYIDVYYLKSITDHNWQYKLTILMIND